MEKNKRIKEILNNQIKILKQEIDIAIGFIRASKQTIKSDKVKIAQLQK